MSLSRVDVIAALGSSEDILVKTASIERIARKFAVGHVVHTTCFMHRLGGIIPFDIRNLAMAAPVRNLFDSKLSGLFSQWRVLRMLIGAK
jgi:hypothetical protein